MAIPTQTVSFPHPFNESPSRTFFQGVQTFQTVTTKNVIDTCTASSPFHLTHLVVNVYDVTAGATVQIKLQNDVIFQFAGTTISTNYMNFGPQGIKGSGALLLYKL
jgi:hypothetical protein